MIKIGKIPAIVVKPKKAVDHAPGVLWIHGGGYITGMKEMVYMPRAMDLVKKFGAVVICPEYRLAVRAPYPAALVDCCKALLYMKKHAAALGINRNQIMVGGESAGGVLCAALCMLVRDKGKVNVAFQMPLYPMLDNLDTVSSRNNHGKVWNTRRNHFGWRMYLRDSGIEASVDVYHSNMHAFDMLRPDLPESREAIRKFEQAFAYAADHYFAENIQEDSFMKKDFWTVSV